jgi:hypothetical protein
MIKHSLSVFFLLLLLPAVKGQNLQSSGEQDSVASGTFKQPVYTTSRLVTSRPVIDGKLNDECWKHGTWAGNWYQYMPNEGAKPTYPTEMNIQYDDKNLYVAFRAFDKEPAKIVRMAGVRDEFVGDMIGINLDSYRDYRTGFEFTVPLRGYCGVISLFACSAADAAYCLIGHFRSIDDLAIRHGFLLFV